MFSDEIIKSNILKINTHNNLILRQIKNITHYKKMKYYYNKNLKNKLCYEKLE
jgi:hypothetical protein